MSTPWIGYCHLRAQTPERQRWIGDRPEAVRWLMLTAGSASDYAQGMRRALGRLGYDMISVSSVAPVDEATGIDAWRAELPQLLAHVNDLRPVPLGDFAPVPVASDWTETDWDQVLAAPGQLWAVIDGVNWPEISKLLGQGDAVHACLYGTLDPESRALAPWLVRVDPGHPLVTTLRARAQGEHAFVLLNADVTLDQMRAHLRRFTMLRTPHDPDQPVYFRFYDPRVMIDAVQAMPDSFLDSFARILTRITVPLSPSCLLPEDARMIGPPIEVFDAPETCQGRLLCWNGDVRANPDRRGPAEVGQAEFGAMGQRMQRRAVLALARELMQEFGELTTRARCTAIAQGAPDHAGRFGMGSMHQVGMIARAQLLFGADFEQRYPQIGQVLVKPALLPWQKAEALETWFTDMTRAHGLTRGVAV